MGRRASAQYWCGAVCPKRSDPLFQRDWIPPQPIHGTKVSPPLCHALSLAVRFSTALKVRFTRKEGVGVTRKRALVSCFPYHCVMPRPLLTGILVTDYQWYSCLSKQALPGFAPAPACVAHMNHRLFELRHNSEYSYAIRREIATPNREKRG